MPSIGDITGRIVLQDVGSPAAIKFGENLEKTSKAIVASMSRATLATETAVREIASKLAKLKTETKDTAVGKGLVADLDSLIKKRQQEITALKAGPAAIEALNQKRYQEAQALKIATAQVQAGVSAESHLGRAIASNIKTLDRYEKELDDLAKAQAKAAQKTEQQIAAYRKLSDVGRTLTTHVTLPILAIGGAAIKASNDFNKGMANVASLIPGAADRVRELKGEVQSLAVEVGKSTEDLSSGLYQVISAFGDTAETADLLALSAKNAIAGVAETSQSIDLLSAVTKSYGDTTAAAVEKVSDLSLLTVRLGKTTLPELAGAMGRVTPIAQSMGQSQEELFATFATFSGVTGTAAEVATQYRGVLAGLLKPTEDLAALYKAVGVESGEALLQQRGFVGALQLIQAAADQTKKPITDFIASIEAAPLALAAAGPQAEEYKSKLKAMGAAAGTTTEAFDEQTKGVNAAGFAFDQAKQKMIVAAQKLGDDLAPAAAEALEKVVALVEAFSNLSDPAKTAIIGIGGLAAAIGPLVFVTGQLLLAWRQIVMFTPKLIAALNSTSIAMAGVRLGIAGIIGAGIYAFLDGLIDKWKEATQAVIDYNVEVGNVEGSALAFAQKVAQGPLYSIVSEGEFANRIKQAETLKAAILSANAELEKMRKPLAGKDNVAARDLADTDFFNPDRARTLKQELTNLWMTYGKLRTALAGVTVAGEKTNTTLEDNPFGNLNLDAGKATDTIADLTAELIRQTQALKLLQDGVPVERIENLLEAARELGKVNLFDPLVEKVADLKDGIDAIATAFELAAQARDKLADAGDDLDELIKTLFESFGGGNDPQMRALLDNLKEAKSLTDSVASADQKRLQTAAKAQALYEQGLITATDLQAILLANADQWNVELDETQLKFNEIYAKLSDIAEGIAYDLVANWRRAWEENESIVNATVDTLRDTFLNVLQDIISQWLSTWFKAMAAWLARWIATQKAAQAASATTGATSGFSNSSGGLGNFAYGFMGKSTTGGVSANTLARYALAAYAIYVVYKGFIEDHKRKFARVEIIDGQSQMTAWHGKKYMEGVQQAAQTILANIAQFLDEIDVTMTRLGTVIIESSKSGFNVSMSPTSTGKLFKSMEEAISYAQVLMLKYGEFADSVSLLVRSVIQSSKAITIEDLASDIAFAKELETQNLEQTALDVQRAMDLAIAQWKRAEDLFLDIFDHNLPAFAEAATSIITKLGGSLWSTFNQLSGIEEDPAKAWERQRIAYNAQRAIILAQIKLWELEIAARIKSFDAQKRILGGGSNRGDGAGRGSGIIGIAYAALTVAGVLADAVDEMDPALKALLDIQKQLQDISLPPELKPEDYPGLQRGGRGGRQNLGDLRADLLDEIDQLVAEMRGSLFAALFDLNQQIEEFTERAKEAKLPAEEIARAVELMTRKFQDGLRAQAEAFAGLGTDFTRKLKEVGDFFDQLRELGRKQTGMPNWLVNLLEGEALESLGAELNLALDQFMGLVDPMAAINAQAEILRQNVIAYGEAAGWTAEQLAEALDRIGAGIDFQRQQGINSLLDRLFAYAREAGIYQEEAAAFEREKALLDLQIIEAQLQFYGALTGSIQDMIDRIRGFVNSPQFGRDNRSDEVLNVRVVDDEADIFTELFENIKSAVEDWRAAIDDFAKSTQDLLTDEELSGLTQEEQLAAARARVEDLIARAQAGDVDAIAQLADARREFLEELRESEGGGFGFQEGWEWIMNETAELLANAQQGEQNLIADMLEGWEVPIHRMPDLLEDLNTTMYEGIAQIVDALYNALGGVPGFASGGIVMSGPRLVRVAEYIPEAIVPLDKLSTMIPYRPQPMDRVTASGMAASGHGYRYASFNERDSLARLSAVEASNSSIARSMAAIEKDISAMRRKR